MHGSRFKCNEFVASNSEDGTFHVDTGYTVGEVLNVYGKGWQYVVFGVDSPFLLEDENRAVAYKGVCSTRDTAMFAVQELLGD